MKLKLIPIIVLITVLLISCGFRKKAQPIIILSSYRITENSAKYTENTFKENSKVYYGLYAPEGFRNPYVRMQLSKQDDKTSNWGFSIIQSHNIYLSITENFYKSYFYVKQKGHYIIQFFYLNNRDYPFAHREFRVE